MSINRESGFSLIEILVTALLFGVIAWMTSNYFSKQQKMSASQEGRDEAVKVNQYLASILRRDLQFSLSPTDVTLASAHEITIRRPKRQLNGAKPDPSQIYQVTYRAVCEKVPGSLQAKMNKVDFTKVTSNVQARSSCLKTSTLKCAAGTYPQLRIQHPPGTDIPGYSAPVFPDLSSNSGRVNRRVVGVLPCFQRTSPNQITVGLDTFSLKQDVPPDQALDLVGEKLFLVIGNVSDMVILQK